MQRAAQPAKAIGQALVDIAVDGEDLVTRRAAALVASTQRPTIRRIANQERSQERTVTQAPLSRRTRNPVHFVCDGWRSVSIRGARLTAETQGSLVLRVSDGTRETSQMGRDARAITPDNNDSGLSLVVRSAIRWNHKPKPRDAPRSPTSAGHLTRRA